MTTLIIPCAGKSSRFGNSKPKAFLTHPNGNLMFMQALFGLNLTNVTEIIIPVLKEHIEKYSIDLNKITEEIYSICSIYVQFMKLDNVTSSQAETIYETIKYKKISGPIFIKDCDNYFNVQITEGNYVCTSALQSNTNALNKSYVSIDRLGYLSGIVEKQVIGNKFCVGGYSFQDSQDFIQAFEAINQIDNINYTELYISHIIQYMLCNQKSFEIQDVMNYYDWGTIEDWQKYTSQFNTIFIDLDGVLVENGSEFFQPKWGDSTALVNNVALLNKLYESGKSTIIITTSRKSKYSQETINQLIKFGIKYHRIIFDLPHAQRILINDYSKYNQYPSAIGICIKRNEDNLEDLLRGKE